MCKRHSRVWVWALQTRVKKSKTYPSVGTRLLVVFPMATMHVILVANDEETLYSLKKDLFLFYVGVFIYMYTRILCVQCQHGPEEDIRFPGATIQIVMSYPV